MKEIISILCPLCPLCKRNVGSLGIQRIGRCAIQLVGDERQRMIIKAFLHGRISRGRDGTRPYLEVSLVMRCENAFDVNDRRLSIASLNGWREYPFSDSIRRIIVVVITNFTTASFRPADIETMGTILRSWVFSGTAGPNWINTGVVVPGPRCFEISVGVDSTTCEMGG